MNGNWFYLSQVIITKWICSRAKGISGINIYLWDEYKFHLCNERQAGYWFWRLHCMPFNTGCSTLEWWVFNLAGVYMGLSTITATVSLMFCYVFLQTYRSFRPVPICKSFSFHACIMNINVSVVTMLIFPNRAFVHHHHHHSGHTSPSLSPPISTVIICILIIILITNIIIITIATMWMAQSLLLSCTNKVAVIHFSVAMTAFITPQ